MEKIEDKMFDYIASILIEIIFGNVYQQANENLVKMALEKMQVRENIREFLNASNKAST